MAPRARARSRPATKTRLGDAVLRRFSTVLMVLVTVLAGPAQGADADIVMWGHPACPHCKAAHLFLAGLRERRPDLRIVEHDVTQAPETYEELRARTEGAGLDMVGLPSFVVRGRFLVGFDTAETTGLQIEALLAPAGAALTVEHGPAHAPGSDAPRVPESRGASPEGTVELPVFVNIKSSPRMLAIAGSFVLVSGFAY